MTSDRLFARMERETMTIFCISEATLLMSNEVRHHQGVEGRYVQSGKYKYCYISKGVLDSGSISKGLRL